MSESKEKGHLRASQRQAIIKEIEKKTEIKDSRKSGDTFL